MGQYSKIGDYSGYKKNNAERAVLDYYSTPTEEVENILDIIKLDFSNQTILENSIGGGHMMDGIVYYLEKNNQSPKKIIGTDVQDRGFLSHSEKYNSSIKNILNYYDKEDFLSNNYPFIENIDTIIMNPPFSTIEPFVMKSIQIAKKYIIMLGRLQFIESESRFYNIFNINPPTYIFQYVDRIQCYKNGDTSIKEASIQAYAWFVWDLSKPKKTELIWIRRANKK